jgi:competence protein ComEC
MILGVPFALLASLWLAWNADATRDGDPTARGIAITVAMAVGVGGAWMSWRGRTGTSVAMGLALLATSAGALRATLAVRNPTSSSPVTAGVVAMRATVDGEPEWRGSGVLVPVHVEAIARAPGTWEAVSGPATMRAPGTVVVVAGDVIEAEPHAATRTSFAVREIRRLAVAAPSGPADTMLPLRRRLAIPIEAWLPVPESSLATGVLLGDRTGVPPSVRAAFNVTGAAHLVAISGWNVSLVAAMVGWVMARGRPRRRMPWHVGRAIVTSAVLWGFVALVGASGSVMRAAVMAQIGLLARMTGRRAAVAGTLLWGAVGMTMVDPPTLDDVGWQLSFLGAAGLVWLSPWIEARLAPLASTRWHWVFPGGVREAIAGAMGAYLCVLPVLAGTLGSVPLLGLVATTPGLLLVPPLMVASAALSVTGVALAGWPTAIDWVMPTIGTLAWVPTTLLVRLVEWAALLPGTRETSPPWHPVAMLAYLVGLSLLVMASESPPRVRPPRSRPGNPVGARPIVVGLGMVAAAATLLVAVPEIDTALAFGAPSSGGTGTPTVVAGPGPDARVIVPSLAGQSEGTLAVIAVPGGPRVMIGGGPTVEAGVHVLGASIRPWDRTVDAIVMVSSEVPSTAGISRVVERYPVGAVIDLTDGSSFGLLPAIRAHARTMGVSTFGTTNGAPVVVGDPSRVPGGPCPATSPGAIGIVPIGASPARGGVTRGPSVWPAVAVRVCAGWVDVTIVPDVTGAAIWLAHAPASETYALAALSGRPRWLVVPWQAVRSEHLDVIRQASGAALVVVQGTPEPWRPPASRPTAGNWWVTALDGPLDVGRDR